MRGQGLFLCDLDHMRAELLGLLCQNIGFCSFFKQLAGFLGHLLVQRSPA